MLAQAARTQLAGFIVKDEGARGGQLMDEVIIAKPKAEGLAADRGFRLEIVNDLELVGRPRQGGERRAIHRDLDRLADDQRLDLLVLLDDAGFFDGVDEAVAAAVAAGELAD